MFKLPLVEVSAKVRTGPPIDDEEDYSLAVWAGVVPLELRAAAPINDDRLPLDIEAPDYARDYARPARHTHWQVKTLILYGDDLPSS